MITWQVPPSLPVLSKDEVHVWCGRLDGYTEQQIENFFVLLDATQQGRANRFRFPQHRTRFVVAHGIFKQILARYLQIPPQQMVFYYNQHGKPFVENQMDLQFNLSHSQEKVLIAITQQHLVGIDLEYTGNQRDIDAIAQRFFASSEYRTLHPMPDEEKQRTFLISWTCKEAILKALGVGLSVPPAKIELDLTGHQPGKLIALHDLQENRQDWHLTTFQPASDYIAALAVKGKVNAIKNWQWQEAF